MNKQLLKNWAQTTAVMSVILTVIIGIGLGMGELLYRQQYVVLGIIGTVIFLGLTLLMALPEKEETESTEG